MPVGSNNYSLGAQEAGDQTTAPAIRLSCCLLINPFVAPFMVQWMDGLASAAG